VDSKNGWKYKKAYYNADIILQFPINSCKNDILKSFIEKLYYFIEKICYLVARFCVGTSVIFITFFCCSRRCCRSCCRWFFIVEVKMIEIVFVIVLDLTVIFAGIIWFFENWLISSPEYCIGVCFSMEMIFSDAALSDIFTSKSQMMIRKFFIMPAFAICALVKCTCILFRKLRSVRPLWSKDYAKIMKFSNLCSLEKCKIISQITTSFRFIFGFYIST